MARKYIRVVSHERDVIKRFNIFHITDRRTGWGEKHEPIDPKLANTIVRPMTYNPSQSRRFIAK